jgi:Domain of unknown function (DUF4390)
MMAFFTHFLKNKQLNRAKMLVRWLVAFVLFATAAAQVAFAASQEGVTPASISAIQVERADGAAFLNAQLKFDLPPAIEDVLLKGIPLFFVAEAEVRRDRWYWYDKKLAVVTRQVRLAYQLLTRRWRLNVSSGSGNASSGVGGGAVGALGGGLPQYFDTLEEAMSKVQRINRWRIVELAELDPDVLHTIELSFKLDVSQLPRPFQIGLIGQSDWNISASKSIRFASEVSK